VKARKRSGDDTDTDFQAESDEESADEEPTAAIGGDEVAPSVTPARAAVTTNGFIRPKPQPKGASTKALAQAVAKISSRSSPMSKTPPKKPSTSKGYEVKKSMKNAVKDSKQPAATNAKATSGKAALPMAVKTPTVRAPNGKVAEDAKSTSSTQILSTLKAKPTLAKSAGKKPHASKAPTMQASTVPEPAPLQPYRLSFNDIQPISVPSSTYSNPEQHS